MNSPAVELDPAETAYRDLDLSPVARDIELERKHAVRLSAFTVDVEDWYQSVSYTHLTLPTTPYV